MCRDRETDKHKLEQYSANQWLGESASGSPIQDYVRTVNVDCLPVDIITLPPTGKPSIVISVSVCVCVCVCVFVCLRSYLLNYTYDLNQIFFIHVTYSYLWPWLGRPLAA